MSSNDEDHSRPTASTVVLPEAGGTLVEGNSASPSDPSQQITQELRPPESFRGDKSSTGEDNAGVGASGLASFPPIDLSDQAREHLECAARHSEFCLGSWNRMQSVLSTVTGGESDDVYKHKERKALEERQGSFQTANTTNWALLEVIKTVYTSPRAATWGLDPGDGAAARELAESVPTVDGNLLVDNMLAKLSDRDRATWAQITTRLRNCDNGAADKLTKPQRDAIYGRDWMGNKDNY